MASHHQDGISLKWQDDEGAHEQRFDGDMCRLGRAPENDVCVASSSVSRRHAMLFRARDGW